jgi:hypothetical protein
MERVSGLVAPEISLAAIFHIVVNEEGDETKNGFWYLQSQQSRR